MSADCIIANAKVFTGDAKNPSAEAVAVQGNRILFVGGLKEVDTWKGTGTREIDAAGNTLLSGFNDNHFHLFHGALELAGMQFNGFGEYAQVRGIIVEYARANPHLEWLVGRKLSYSAGPDHKPLARQDLDAIEADRPVILLSYDGHTAWANTRALELAGIRRGGDCGANSEIVLDAAGEATGELRESGAFTKVFDLIPQPDEVTKRRLLREAVQTASRLGVTSVYNMDGSLDQATRYAAMEDTGELTLRVYVPYSVTPDTSVEQLLKEAPAVREQYRSEMVRGGCVKFFIDGVIEAYTGFLVEEYADRPGVFGACNYEIDHYNELVAAADRLGLQISTHAVGDMGVRLALNAYELAQARNGRRDSRHRVEHIEVVHPDDLPRFKQLGVIASMQPMHAPLNSNEQDVWLARVGERRWPLAFAWSAIRSSGAVLSFGSDWPIATQDPLMGIYAALNRQPWKDGMPDQRQDLGAALLSYTRDAAFAEFQHHQRGSLKVGNLADLVLLDRDIFQTPPEAIGAIKPFMTMVDGRIVYES